LGAWGSLTLRIMRSKRRWAMILLDEFGISQPWQRASGRGAAPGLKISEVRGEGAERVRAHSVISERLEGGHIGIGQGFGIAIG
jgi:hypothetical protein